MMEHILIIFKLFTNLRSLGYIGSVFQVYSKFHTIQRSCPFMKKNAVATLKDKALHTFDLQCLA